MSHFTYRLVILCTVAVLTQFHTIAAPPMSGGATSVVIPKAQANMRGAFSLPAANLSLSRRDNFFVGDSFFRGAWVTAPASTAARDGLGPLFNTNSCQSCHIKDGRGHPPESDEQMTSMLIRASVPDPAGTTEKDRLQSGGITPHPVFGGQIQNRSIVGAKPEAVVSLEWSEIEGAYEDGSRYTLRRPKVVISQSYYGEIGGRILLSPRVAQPMIGVGLLDTIPTEAIVSLADPDDKDGDGISGRLNMVWDVESETAVPGRFGWKAEQPTVRQQVASAFLGDIGITSSVFPDFELSEAQKELAGLPHGGDPEVSDDILDFVVFYSKTLSVPAQRAHDNPAVLRGKELFEAAKCSVCHVETFVTGEDPNFPELSGQEVHPYTDLLLHDMGEGLADNRPVYSATGREWRTAPLWGIGLSRHVSQEPNYLHDGRARTIEEAILWHGGEGKVSRDAFLAMSAEERRMLMSFLRSL